MWNEILFFKHDIANVSKYYETIVKTVNNK